MLQIHKEVCVFNRNIHNFLIICNLTDWSIASLLGSDSNVKLIMMQVLKTE